MTHENDWIIETSALSRTYTAAHDTEPGRELSHEQLGFPPLRICRGGLKAIVGASGSGKTTLLNLLSGLDCPDQGSMAAVAPRICLNLSNHPVDLARDPDSLDRGSIGFVFQQGNLLSNASVAFNLAIPNLARDQPVRRSEIDDELSGLLDMSTQFRTKRAYQLSGGQAQRIAFARALLHHPELVFADEPTSSLDTELAADLMVRIKRRWLAPGSTTTILWVTHDLALAASCADQVLVLTPHGIQNYLERRLDCVENPRDVAVISDWVYGRKAFPGLGPIGGGTTEPTCRSEDAASTARDAAATKFMTASRQKRLELRIATRIAIGEMFSNRIGIEKLRRDRGLVAWLARTDPRDRIEPSDDAGCENFDASDAGPQGGRRSWAPLRVAAWAWRCACGVLTRRLAFLRSYSDFPSGIVLWLSATLIALALLALQLNERVYDQTLKEPLTCQVDATGRAGDSGRPPDAYDLGRLAERPWRPVLASGPEREQFEPLPIPSRCYDEKHARISAELYGPTGTKPSLRDEMRRDGQWARERLKK